MEIETLFRADLFIKKNVGSVEQRKKLLAKIEKFKTTRQSMDFSNDLCQRYSFDIFSVPWLQYEINDSVSSAINFYKNKDLFFDNFILEKNIFINSWVNINQPRSKNNIHDHRSAQFSGVYYIQSSTTGNLNFINPANILSDCSPGSPFVREFSFSPTEGDLILWPSWIPHEVEYNFSDKERINIAFDITWKK